MKSPGTTRPFLTKMLLFMMRIKGKNRLFVLLLRND